MEVLLLLLVLSPLAALFSGGDTTDDGGENPGGPTEADGLVQQRFDADSEMTAQDGNENVLLAGAGDDTLDGGDGRDVMVGQAGNDVMTGGDNGDFLLGGAGDDEVYGNSGNDLLVGGGGNDSMAGGEGNDTLFASAGSDRMLGGDGNDVLVGLDVDGGLTRASSIITPAFEADMNKFLDDNFGTKLGGNQSDLVIADLKSTGAVGSDELRGGLGNDSLIGDAGDTLVGGAADDSFSVVDGVGGPVVISDFDPAMEDIRILVANNVMGSLTMANVTAGVELRVGANVVAVLNETTMAELGQAQIRLVRVAAPV